MSAGMRVIRSGASLRAARSFLPIVVLAALGVAWSTQSAVAQIPPPDALTRPNPEAAAERIVVVFPATRTELTVEGRILLSGSDEMFISSAGMATLFQARRSWQDDQRRLAFRVGERTFRLTADSRLVEHDGGETLLRTPVLPLRGDLWLPLEFLTRVLGPALRQAVLWDPDRGRLSVGSGRTNVTDLRIEELTRATAVHIICQEELTYRADSAADGMITVKIYGGEGDLERLVLESPRGLVERIEAGQHPGHVLIGIRPEGMVTSFRAYAAEEGHEIVVVLEEEATGVLPDPTPRGRVNVDLQQPVRAERAPLAVDVVVIDAGHGGAETGKIGPDGIMEKDVNLAIARELKRYFEQRTDLRVVLTREDDTQVSLTRRTELANQAGGDLFLSLHCNGWFSSRASGVETYFLSPAKTERELQVARDENQEWGGGAQADGARDDDISFILWDLVQNRYINESSDLAEMVQARLCGDLGGENRGVKQSGFRVLVGAHMPAILVEMGFLSHAEEQRKLADPDHQRLVAAAIGQAVLEFKARYAAETAAGSPPGEE